MFMRTMRLLRHAGFALAFAAQVPLYGGPVDEVRTFPSNYDGTTQPYRLYRPDTGAGATTAPRPLLVVLHGKGVDHNAWFDFTPVKDHAGRRGYVVAAPLGRGDWFYRGPGEQDVLDTIADVKRVVAIDPDRVYLAGHSMGGWGTWWIGLRNPDLFATIVPMAGWAPPGAQDTHGDGEIVGNALHLDPLIIHDAGDPIVPVSESQAAAAALARAGISHALRIEHGYGHASKMIGDNFDRMFAWFETHRRVAQPNMLRLSTRTPTRGRAYWLEIMETARFPDMASVQATVDSSGTVKIVTENVRTLRLHPDTMPRTATQHNPLRMEVDGQILDATTGSGAICLRAETQTGSAWRQIANAEAQEARRKNPAFDTVSDGPLAALPEGVASESVATAVAATLRQHGAIKTVALPVESFRRPPGVWTKEKLLDVCLLPDDRLVGIVTDTGTLATLDGSQIVPYGVVRIYGEKPAQSAGDHTVKLFAPHFLAARLVEDGQAHLASPDEPWPAITDLLLKANDTPASPE